MKHLRNTTTGTACRAFLALPAILFLSAPVTLAAAPGPQESKPAAQKQQPKEAPAQQKTAKQIFQEKQAASQNGAKSKAELEALRQQGLKHKQELNKVATGKGAYGGAIDPEAKLEIPFGQDSHDFGNVMQGAMLEHSFRFKSSGPNDVIIRQAKPTCGCTVGQLQVVNDDGTMSPYTIGSPIAPGTEIELTAKVDTGNKRNKTQVRINVYANDPVSQHTLTLSAQVEPFMTATPTFVNFGELAEDATKESVIDVRVAKGEAVMLEMDTTRKLSKPQGMEVEMVPVNPNENGKSAHWQVKIKVGPNLKEGPLGYAMTLVTDKEIAGSKPLPDGRQKRYQINANVNGRVLGVLSCSPQYVSMGLVRPGQVVKRSMQVISHDSNFEIGNPKVTLRGYKGADFPWADHFKITTSPIAGRNGVSVELRLDGLPNNSDGSFKGEVVIETGHPAKPEMAVIFSGVCRSGIAAPTGATPQKKGVPLNNKVQQAKPAQTAKEPFTNKPSGKGVGAKAVKRPGTVKPSGGK
ncbi:MAG: hypothetical protein ACI841_004275 [Planctomycetota bacterium]|jgi:hypothetical protein